MQTGLFLRLDFFGIPTDGDIIILISLLFRYIFVLSVATELIRMVSIQLLQSVINTHAVTFSTAVVISFNTTCFDRHRVMRRSLQILRNPS